MSIPLLLCSLAFAAPAPAQADTGTEVPLAERLDLFLTRLEPLGFSGAVLVMRGDEVLLEQGYGLAQRDAEIPMGPRTALPVGSISKQFTAAAIMRLVMVGELTLDTQLDDVFEGAPPDKARITVHQLLTHTSGLPGYSGFRTEITSAEQLVRSVLETELMFPPGAEEEYSNLGYGLLAAIVERVSGVPYEDYLRREILLPSGMRDTGIRSAEWSDDALAHGYIDGRDQGALGADWPATPWHLLGAGGVCTTLEDMARWERALREHSVLDEATLDLMTTPHISHGPSGTGYGYGVFQTRRGTRMVGHDGSNDIYGADWRRYLDEDVMIFVASNDADLYAMDVSPSIARIVFGADLPLPPELIEFSAPDLDAYAGRYMLEDGGVVSVDAGTRGLFLSSSDVAPAKALNPVPGHQELRREDLLLALPLAFEEAFGGEFGGLHQLLDPFAPLGEFTAMQREMLDQFVRDNGDLLALTAVPGRNRFGEIALVLGLVFERGEQLIEFSFGEHEVGSIRFIEGLPRRAVRPASATEFLDYDLQTRATWSVLFELDEAGQPAALLISRPGGREALRARRL